MNPRSSKKRSSWRPSKSGTPFEVCVATVARALSPNAVVTQGAWIEGPDGRRDQDVLVEVSEAGKSFRCIIECKDYDKNRTGPVGIDIVDKLESKRRDIPCDMAIICSNAGFTDPALRKASRVGISLVGVFREGDERIRFTIAEYFYFRRLKIERLGVRLDRLVDGVAQQCSDSVSAKYLDAPVGNWVCHHIVGVIMNNPIGAGKYEATFRFKEPTKFSLDREETFEATSLFAEVSISGGWFEQLGSIDGTAGLYDFIRRRAQVGEGPYQVHFMGMDLTKGTPVSHPPREEIDFPDGRRGEMWMQLLYLVDCNCKEPIPPLHELIVPEDLDPNVRGLPPELQRSASNPAHPPDRRSFFVARNPRIGADHSITITSQGKPR